MRGFKDYNFPAFHEGAALLREAGWKVESPAERDEQDETHAAEMEKLEDFSQGIYTLAQYMEHDLAMVCRSDAVFVLPGWEKSQGARLEAHVAWECDIPVYSLATTAEIEPPHRGTDLWPVEKPLGSGGVLASKIGSPTPREILPTGSSARKDIPITTGVIDYFPAALAAVAAVSKAGNDKHNPGEPLHWARSKSTDEADAIGRHLIERGGVDPETGQRHSAQLAWRALALLQKELEEAGESPLARGAKP